jgi:hypothetical protein
LAGRKLTLKVLLELGKSLIESVQFSLFTHASIKLFLKIDLQKACTVGKIKSHNKYNFVRKLQLILEKMKS